LPRIKIIRKLFLDNDAIYVAAMLYDDEPSFKETFTVFCTSVFLGFFMFRIMMPTNSLSILVKERSRADSATIDDYLHASGESKVDNNQFGWAVVMRIPYAVFRRKKKTN
jgi:hypothetical protein